jgi:hypothetical protein
MPCPKPPAIERDTTVITLVLGNAARMASVKNNVTMVSRGMVEPRLITVEKLSV